MKKFRLILIAFITLTLSCSKDNQYQDFNDESYLTKGFELTLDEMRSIGVMHNEIFLQLHQIIDLKCENCDVKVTNELKSILQTKLNSLIDDQEYKNSLANRWIDEAITNGIELNLLDYDIKTWKNDILSESGMIFYRQIERGINESSSVRDFDMYIDKLVTKIQNSNLSNYEKELIIISAEVGRKSFELWAPRKIGGLGLFNDINKSKSKILRRWCWKCALAGDVGGVTAYVNGLAVTGLINAAWVPGANGAIAVGAAASAVGGSVISGSGVFSADKLEALPEDDSDRGDDEDDNEEK